MLHAYRYWPADADVWRFRRHWLDEKALLRAELLAGTYQVGLLRRVILSMVLRQHLLNRYGQITCYHWFHQKRLNP